MTAIRGGLEGSGLKIGIVVSRWNGDITSGLLAGAQRAFIACGVPESHTSVVEVPGAFEIPLAVRELLDRGCDAVVALGCVIKGETAHFEYVANAAMEGIARLSLQHGKPVTCGILTTYDHDQARVRSGEDENNKGSEAALSAIEMANTLRRLRA